MFSKIIIRCAIAVTVLTAPFMSYAEDERLMILTENYGSFNFSMQDREFEHKEEFIGGTSTEFMKKLLKHSKLPYKMKLRAWSVSYERALNKPYHGVFSTSRTEPREPLFEWIGPIAKINTVLYVKKGSNIKINSLADLDGLRVGGYKNDANTNFLVDRGIPVIAEAIDSINPKKLAQDYIDVWVAADFHAHSIAEHAGYPDIQAAFTVTSLDMYLAMNKQTPKHIIDKLRNSYDELVAQGELK